MQDNTNGVELPGWSLDRKISVANLLVMVSFVIGAMTWSFSVERRVAIIESLAAVHREQDAEYMRRQAERDHRQDEDVQRCRQETNAQLGALNAKLDWLVSRVTPAAHAGP